MRVRHRFWNLDEEACKASTAKPRPAGLTKVGQVQANSKLNRVRSLRPDDPLFPVVMAIPIHPRVTFHSIIGQINTDEPKAKGNDTFVEYWSSHVDFSVSEKIVDSKHTTITKDDGAIAEMSRILHLHLRR